MRGKLFWLILVGGLASAYSGKTFAQAPPTRDNGVLTVTSVALNPQGPAVGSNYTVTASVQSRENGLVHGEITLPHGDRVVSGPSDQPITAGGSTTLSWTVYCGVSGGNVRVLANLVRAGQIPATELVGEFTADDAKDTVRTKSYCKNYSYKMEKGRTYQIDMKSKTIDSYLRLENPAGAQVAADDDGGGYPDARIIHKAQESGDYQIVATTFAGGTGKFTLTVRDTSALGSGADANQAIAFNSTWVGTENLAGFNSLTFAFKEDGKVHMIDARSTVAGTWTQSGRNVTIRFGNCVYNGQINGAVIEGAAQATDGTSRTWSFRVHTDSPRAEQPDSAKGAWAGSEDLAGFGSLTFIFGEDGKMTMTDAKSTDRGTWTQTGRTVTIHFSNCVYTGEMDGAVLAGTAHYTEGAPRTWSFRVHKR